MKRLREYGQSSKIVPHLAHKATGSTIRVASWCRWPSQRENGHRVPVGSPPPKSLRSIDPSFRRPWPRFSPKDAMNRGLAADQSPRAGGMPDQAASMLGHPLSPLGGHAWEARVTLSRMLRAL